MEVECCHKNTYVALASQPVEQPGHVGWEAGDSPYALAEDLWWTSGPEDHMFPEPITLGELGTW